MNPAQGDVTKMFFNIEKRVTDITIGIKEIYGIILKVNTCLPVKVICNNISAIQIYANPIFHKRTIHLKIDLHLVRAKVAAGRIIVVKT